MSDPFKYTTKQELTIQSQAKERTAQKKAGKSEKGKEGKEDKDYNPCATLYSNGITLLEKFGYILQLEDGGTHCNHRILKATYPKNYNGLTYPESFKPYQDIYTDDDLMRIDDDVFKVGKTCSQKTRDFWTPLFHPKSGDSDLMSYTQLRLKMAKIRENRNLMDPVDLGHSFDPAGRLGNGVAVNPKVWVPDREWFSKQVQDLTMEDVFTIFPKAEIKMLELILGRIGVGASGHIPTGWDKPISHTARMAGVIVGKDPGLGKSTLFNGMTAAFAKCGFVTQTFKSTDERFGMRAITAANIAYKDDTSLTTLKKFLSSEETKTIITNGRIQVEDKFMNADQVMARTVFLVNSNDWNNKFAYDLDPGIMDRIKIISTYKECEVFANAEKMKGMVSEGSPDLRPRAHIPYLANKLGVDEHVIYLWCLRLATDNFWKIITDNSNPKVNSLQVAVRHWTTRMRIRFKTDVMQALVNSLAFSWAMRSRYSIDPTSPPDKIPELNTVTLKDCLESFYFIGVDPSAQQLIQKMKKLWDDSGRIATHYYEGFREVRWDSVKKALNAAIQLHRNEETDSGSTNFSDMIKEIVGKVDLRDGFKIGAGSSYVNEDWANMRFAFSEIIAEVDALSEEVDPRFMERIRNTKVTCNDKWIKSKYYSPDIAEGSRSKAIKEMFPWFEGEA